MQLRRTTEKRNDAIAEYKELHAKVFLRCGVRNVSIPGGYHLALAKNKADAGHTSASAALALVGGQPWQGALKDKSIVSRFETYTAVAQRLKCQADRKEADALIADMVVLAGDDEQMSHSCCHLSLHSLHIACTHNAS